MFNSGRNVEDDPFAFVMHLTHSHNTDTARYIDTLPSTDLIAMSCRSTKDSIKNSNKTKVKTYLSLSPALLEPPLYHLDIPEYVRAAATRFRLSAHSLRIETGRWARLPRQERLCTCGDGVQDELHVTEHCRLIRDIRDKYYDLDFNCVSLCKFDIPAKAWAIYDILTFFK
jgi:hypothetical protein